MSGSGSLSRRDVLKATAGAAIASQVTAIAPVLADAPALKFFTPAQFALVDELSEILIPTDDHSPGAKAAGVARYIDGEIADAFQDDVRRTWKDGLAQVDALATSMHGGTFMTLTPAQRIEIVTKMAANEQKPVSDLDKFFRELKSRTVHAYYTSDIGIHKEMEYKGNVMLQEFVGTDVSHEVSKSSR